MVTELPEQLISQAEFLLRETAFNEANVRRAVSSAYYALFHLLIRDAVVNWKHADEHARLARAFDHKRMKDASMAILKEIGTVPSQVTAGADTEQASRFRLSTVAQAFVDLQQARHKADYDIGEPFGPVDAAVDVAQARLAFVTWAGVRDEPIAQRYLYSLLFKDRS
ncbi:MAG: hypothetical protein ABSB15_14945 [Bryobacteraceae bacterium]